MSVADLIIPEWGKVVALAAAAALVFGAGYKAGLWYEGHKSAAEIEAAKRETAELRANVSTAAAKQAEIAVQAAARQINTLQEVTRDSTTRARALDQRIAAGGLRLGSAIGGNACRLPTGPGDPRASADAPAQSLPAGAERDTGAVSGDLDQALQSAARDAQQVMELIDAAYKIGCAGQ